MFIFFIRGNDTLKIKVKSSKYIVFALDTKELYCFALKKGQIYSLKDDSWKEIKYENENGDSDEKHNDLSQTCDFLVECLRGKGWTTWQYQREMLSKLICDLHEKQSVKWLFNDEKEIKKVELHHKNVLIYYQDKDIQNYCFSHEDLSGFEDYEIFKNKPKIHIKDGLRIPVKDVN